MNQNRQAFGKGLRDGIPIAICYLAVSFTLGIAARNTGLTAFQAGVLSFSNLTSAGEFAGLGLMSTGATLLEVAVTLLIVNLRYCLMSTALSQKLPPETSLLQRLLMATGVTDEIFGVSVGMEGRLNPYHTFGLICLGAPGWTVGTVLGVLCGNILPTAVVGAMSMGMFAMFIAAIVPPGRRNKVVAVLVILSMTASFLFTRLPVLKGISSGFRIILLTLVLAGAAAVLFPVREVQPGQRKEIPALEENHGTQPLPVYSRDGGRDLSDSRLAAYAYPEAD